MPQKSHVRHGVLDPQPDDAALTDLWEYPAAAHLDAHTRVKAFVKKDHLGLSTPYRFQEGEEGHQYLPDFLVVGEAEDGQETTLILEVKGYRHNRVMAKHQANGFPQGAARGVEFNTKGADAVFNG